MQLRSRGLVRPVRRFVRRELLLNCSGASAVEFAIVLPVFLLLLLAIIKAGIVFNHYVELANGVAAGARELSISRGTSTAYSNTLTAMHQAAPNLNPFSTPRAGQTVTMTVAGTACTSANQGSTCAGAFVEGNTAVVAATYPCDLSIMGLTIANCALSTSSTEYIQ